MARGGLLGVSANQLIICLAGLCISLGTFAVNSLYAQVKADGESAARNVSNLQIEQRNTESRVARVEDAVKHTKENLDEIARDMKEQSQKIDRIIHLQLQDARRATQRDDSLTR